MHAPLTVGPTPRITCERRSPVITPLVRCIRTLDPHVQQRHREVILELGSPLRAAFADEAQHRSPAFAGYHRRNHAIVGSFDGTKERTALLARDTTQYLTQWHRSSFKSEQRCALDHAAVRCQRRILRAAHILACAHQNAQATSMLAMIGDQDVASQRRGRLLSCFLWPRRKLHSQIIFPGVLPAASFNQPNRTHKPLGGVVSPMKVDEKVCER